MKRRGSSLVDLLAAWHAASGIKSVCPLLATGQSAGRMRLPFACVTLSAISEHQDASVRHQPGGAGRRFQTYQPFHALP